MAGTYLVAGLLLKHVSWRIDMILSLIHHRILLDDEWRGERGKIKIMNKRQPFSGGYRNKFSWRSSLPELACRHSWHDGPWDADDVAGVGAADGKTIPFVVARGCSSCVASLAARSHRHWCSARDRANAANALRLAMLDAIQVCD